MQTALEKEIRENFKINERLEIIKNNQKEIVFKCDCCNYERKIYKLYFSPLHLNIVLKVFRYCLDHRTNTFDKKNIHTLSHTDYGNLCFLQRFGLIYNAVDKNTGKEIKGTRGVPLTRVWEFLN